MVNKSGESGLYLGRAGEEVLSLDKIKELKLALDVLDNIIPSIKSFDSSMLNSNTFTSNNNTTLTLNLPNVTNGQQFIEFLQSDKAQAIIKQSTIGSMLGQSKLKRYTV